MKTLLSVGFLVSGVLLVAGFGYYQNAQDKIKAHEAEMVSLAKDFCDRSITEKSMAQTIDAKKSGVSALRWASTVKREIRNQSSEGTLSMEQNVAINSETDVAYGAEESDSIKDLTQRARLVCSFDIKQKYK